MHTIRLNGINLNYLDLNPEKKQSILFLHGNSHSHRNFLFQKDSGFNDYRLLFVDLPGHGDSDRIENYSVRNIARILSEFLTELKIQEVILVGHSLGGHIALNMMKFMNPAGIFLFGTPPLQNPFHPETFLPNPNSIALTQTQASHEDIANLMAEMRYSGEILDLGTEDFLRTDVLFRTGVLADVFTGSHEDEVVLINSFNGEVMILLARADGLINNNYITEVVDTNAHNRTLVEIEAGHSPHVEKAFEFNNLLMDFTNRTFNKNRTIENQYERANERI